ncbi:MULTISPECIES: PIN domain-containing protein [unclassified Microcoleus]|uniref:PIN domain-containing protein n=1 Tax=unclassified Microcoleus TaxID=2642155 RepID=UPI002FD16876
MKDIVRSLFQKYKQKGILIDTNILLLWFVGTVNRERISKFNRTEKFVPEDYDSLVQILSYFNKIVTTPNILTEVNSLANQLGEPERSQCLSVFAEGVARLNESYLESTEVVRTDSFTKFGLTDCSIINLAKNKYLVLTDDFKLANYLQTLGIDTINFNNIRPSGWK